MNTLAGLLSGMRLLLACLIAWTDWATSQQPAIGMLVFLTLLAWPSDALDGPSARWAADRRRTWQGAHDLEADLSVALAWTFTLAVLRGMPIAVLAGRCSWARAAGWRFTPWSRFIWEWRLSMPVHAYGLASSSQPGRAAMVAWIGAVALLTLP